MVTLIAILALGGKLTGPEAAKSLQAFVQQTYTAEQNSKTPDYASAQQKIVAKAKELLTGVTPDTLQASEGMAWASVYEAAGDFKTALVSLDKYLGTKPVDTEAKKAYMEKATDNLQLEDVNGALAAFKMYKPANFGEAYQAAQMASQIADGLSSAKRNDEALALLDDTEKVAATMKAPRPDDADYLTDSIAEEKLAVLSAAGKDAEAVAYGKTVLAKLTPKSRTAASFAAALSRITIKGTDAPEIPFTEKYGDFTNLASLKGKVVVLDFFAHWCGPCKESMPDMRKLTDDLDSKGLEVIGVTGYYGFFGKDSSKKIDKKTEYADMKGFLDQYKIDHPVIFTNEPWNSAYGVTGIPEFVLIGRDGKVKNLMVGYDASGFQDFRKSVEAALAEK